LLCAINARVFEISGARDAANVAHILTLAHGAKGRFLALKEQNNRLKKKKKAGSGNPSRKALWYR